MRVALLGNPNSGKTTLFNALTGSTAHVGNWPGVTVDKKEGVYKKCAEPISVIDLPGVYSLSPYTPEEIITRNYIVDEKPDCVINIIDATNLERNLYLATQALEADVPVVLALNMADVLSKNGDRIDVNALSEKMGAPVVSISALKKTGIKELMDVVYKTAKAPRTGESVLMSSALKPLIDTLAEKMANDGVASPLFHAIKLIEADEFECKNHSGYVKYVDEFKKTFSDPIFGHDFEALVADYRYKVITSGIDKIVVKAEQKTATLSDKIDKVMTNKWAGIPLFIAILFTLFHLTFSEDFLFLSKIFSLPTLEELGLLNEDGEAINFGVSLLACVYDGAVKSPGYILFYLMDLLTSTIAGWCGAGLEAAAAPEWLTGFINDGVLGGLCGILSFVPQILFLLLLLSILEDTGYMARVAFLLDRIFRKFGISGRAFIPMIMGFGCSIPAIVNTRTLADDRERTLTIRTIPFFSCGAKLPILVAIAGAVAHMCGLGDGSFISFAMYIIGMAVAVISIIVMRSTTQRGEVAPFIMELPDYRAPGFKNLMIHLWDKTKHYIQKVFTIILASSIVVWFLTNFTWDWTMVESIDDSILASVGKLVQPVFTPLGFGSQLNANGWVFAVAAVIGLLAKEEVIAIFGTLAAVLSLSELPEIAAEGATDVMAMVAATGITWQALIAYIVFNMTTIPCFAAVAAAKGEITPGKFKWTFLFWILTSFIAASVTYTVLSWWWTAFIWVAVAAITAVLIRLYNKKHPIKA